jgi:hypothetical protein
LLFLWKWKLPKARFSGYLLECRHTNADDSRHKEVNNRRKHLETGRPDDFREKNYPKCRPTYFSSKLIHNWKIHTETMETVDLKIDHFCIFVNA